ncbi:MAG: DUF3592 domain-containing protein [Lachnospiraceae bacterium]|nr:DUF3592 domain-containing protein [Lachnospiraceae bacterium]
MEKKINTNRLLVCGGLLIFIIIGVILICTSVSRIKEDEDFVENAKPVVIYVNKVCESSSGSGTSRSTTYWAYVSYEIDGKAYSNIEVYEDDGAARLKEGETVSAFYHKDKPTWIRADKDSAIFGNVLVILLGVMLCVIGLLPIILIFLGKSNL